MKLGMTRQRGQKLLAWPNILTCLLHQIWSFEGVGRRQTRKIHLGTRWWSLQTSTSPPNEQELFRTKCYFKTHGLYRYVFSCSFVKKYQNLHVFKYIYTYTGGFFKITFYSTKCLQMQRVSADSWLCTWCIAWMNRASWFLVLTENLKL